MENTFLILDNILLQKSATGASVVDVTALFQYLSVGLHKFKIKINQTQYFIGLYRHRAFGIMIVRQQKIVFLRIVLAHVSTCRVGT